jgi:hypothetical protein
MRSVHAVLLAAVLSALVLSGCQSAAGTDAKMVDDYCHRCAEYVSDYSHAIELPRVTPEAQQAMMRMEAKGDAEHVAAIAATIVRRARANPAMEFSPAGDDLDRQFCRWVHAKVGQMQPWKPRTGTATVADVTRWIKAHRDKLPASKLLDDELAKCP